MVDNRLYSFIKVVELGSYTKAAKQLSLSQPAVSQQIRQLEELLGVNLLRNRLGVEQLSLRDMNGSPAVLEIRRGSSRLTPRWAEDGALRGLELTVKVEAALLEGNSRAIDEDYLDDLAAKLEATISGQLRSLLRRAKLLRADYLELGPRVEAAAPLAFQRLEAPFSELLPGLEISLTVQGSIQHEYDME